MERESDFAERRKHLADMSEADLENRFWELAGKLVDPLVDLAYTHTSPSIERSVLLRMGFSSMEAKAIVGHALEHELLQKGAGHIVYKLASEQDLSIREAGLKLADNSLWETAETYFK